MYVYTAKIILLIGVLYCLVFSFFSESPFSNSQDTLFLVDVSRSMDVVDISLGVGSISRAQYTVDLVQKHMPHTGTYGIIAFANDAQVLLPFTDDTVLAPLFLTNTQARLYMTGGSNIASALTYTQNYIQEHGFDGSVVLISDGGDEVFDVEEFALIDKNVFTSLRIFGVGSKTGGVIPDGIDTFGNIQPKIYQGEEVLSQRNDDYLQGVADALEASYVSLDGSDVSGPSSQRTYLYVAAFLLLMYMFHTLLLPIFSTRKHA